MKVVAFNGSPRKKGNTAGSLAIVLAELDKARIETELVQAGKETIHVFAIEPTGNFVGTIKAE